MIEVELGPIEVDLLTYHRLLYGEPLIGEVIGGRLDGLKFEVDEVRVDGCGS